METVDEWSTYLFKLYGEAHQYHFTSHHQRITHLNIGVRALRNVARGKIEALTLPQAIARCIGRTIYVSHLFTGLPLSQVLISNTETDAGTVFEGSASVKTNHDLSHSYLRLSVPRMPPSEQSLNI